MKRAILIIASILGFFSVLIGAMGAHYFSDYLVLVDRVNTFETAVRFQFYHTFFLFFLGFSYDFTNIKLLRYAFLVCVTGIILFSGSLYVLCLTNISFFGIITPFGGILLMFSWLIYLYSLMK
tara:strand:+ start:476 stop:844 length:369 start_codon:yes stop_codon:yes gene_type:complete